MFRHLILPTLIAILLIPDWASAFFRRRTPPPCSAVPVQKVQFYPTAYSTPPCPPMFLAPAVSCCPSAMVAPAPNSVKSTVPQVVPERMAVPNAIAPAPESTTPPVAPKVEKPIEPKPPSLIPSPDTKLPELAPAVPKITVETIKPVTGEEKLPPTEVPSAPPLPKLTFDPVPTPAPTPTPAPAKDSNLLPAPVSPDKVLPKMELPNLDLPSAPPLAIPKSIEVKSSPITEEKAANIEIFPVDGVLPSDPNEKRLVTFRNFSGRDQVLTIDGKAYVLPAKHMVEGKLNPQFKLRVGTGEVQEMSMPASATGIEIVLKK